MIQPGAEDLHIEVVRARELDRRTLTDVLELCVRAYEDEDISGLYATFESPTHVIGWLGATIASHALWVTRRLQGAAGLCCARPMSS
jgi:hypothetical protein